MLNQQPPEETNADDNMSVTSQEMAKAIAAIEKRKTEQAQRLTGTAQVRQVVQELGIDATPEEVLAEVRRQRLSAEPEIKPTATAAHQPRFQNPFVNPQKRRRGRIWFKWAAGMGLGWLLLVNFGHNIGLAGWNAPGSTTTLSQVADDDRITIDTPSLVKVLNGAPQSSIIVDKSGQGSLWWLRKHDGKLYLQGFLAARITNQAASTAPVEIYNAEQDTPGDTSSEVTVPLNGVHLMSAQDKEEDSTITLSNVHLDKLAWKHFDD